MEAEPRPRNELHRGGSSPPQLSYGLLSYSVLLGLYSGCSVQLQIGTR